MSVCFILEYNVLTILCAIRFIAVDVCLMWLFCHLLTAIYLAFSPKRITFATHKTLQPWNTPKTIVNIKVFR